MSTSTNEDLDISKYLFLSSKDFLAHPSAKFEATETDALLSWFVIPNNSDLGKPSVSL